MEYDLTPNDYADSVKKCDEGIEQIEAGKGIPADEFFAKFFQRSQICLDPPTDDRKHNS